MRRLALFALTMSAATAFAAPATAEPACSDVQVVIPGPVIRFGPFCVPYDDPVVCDAVIAGTGDPTVIVTVCRPAP